MSRKRGGAVTYCAEGNLIVKLEEARVKLSCIGTDPYVIMSCLRFSLPF